MDNDAKHHFIRLFAICTSFLVKYLSLSFTHLKIGLFDFLLLKSVRFAFG